MICRSKGFDVLLTTIVGTGVVCKYFLLFSCWCFGKFSVYCCEEETGSSCTDVSGSSLANVHYNVIFNPNKFSYSYNNCICLFMQRNCMELKYIDDFLNNLNT